MRGAESTGRLVRSGGDVIGGLVNAFVLLLAVLLQGPASGSKPDGPFVASDWTSTGSDCQLYCAGDFDGDGFDDLFTVNGARDLCVAFSVRGWKSAGWGAVAHDVDPEAPGLVAGEFDASSPGIEVAVVRSDRVEIHFGRAGSTFAAKREIQAPEGSAVAIAERRGRRIVRAVKEGRAWVLGDGAFVADDASSAAVSRQHDGSGAAAPPYDQSARCVTACEGDFNGDGEPDRAYVFACRLPHRYNAVRVLFGSNVKSGDADGDGLTDVEESALGCDPRSRDSDGDGLLDGWEVHGLPRGISLGSMIDVFDAAASADERDRRLSPLRQDVIVNVSYFKGVVPEQFRKEMPRVQRVFRDLASVNVDGTHGVWVHFREIEGFVTPEDQRMPWWDVGNKYFPERERGLMHWMQVTPHGGGQSGETADMGGCGNGWAVFAHEFGHQLSLSHTGDSAPAWCPLYTSMMNYAYHYSFDGDGNKSHLSNGEFRSVVLDERHLRETLPFPIEKLGFLSNHPFRFPLKDAGDGTTLVDWNQNGAFDTSEVEADINYGGSTHAGERKTLGLIGSAPSLAYIGNRCVLTACDHKQTTTTVRAYKGAERWTAELNVPNSATRFDPVIVGGADEGVLLVRRFDAWAVAPVSFAEGSDEPRVGALQALPALPATDLSATSLGARVMIVTRHDDDRLERRWLNFEAGGAAHLTEPVPLAMTSMVPVGLARDPSSGAIAVVGSARHEKHGPFCMRVGELTMTGETVTEGPVTWTHGHGRNHCTSRPVPVFRAAAEGATPQLIVFHTGWCDANGTWSAWRTTRIGNRALDDGWLTSQLYDEWTRSRVALGFADGAQGPVYAFRWDPGDHRDWEINTAFLAYGGYGIDDQPMRDFDDAAKISLWGIRQSILEMRRMPEDAATAK